MQIQQSGQLLSSYKKKYQEFRNMEAHFPITLQNWAFMPSCEWEMRSGRFLSTETKSHSHFHCFLVFFFINRLCLKSFYIASNAESSHGGLCVHILLCLCVRSSILISYFIRSKENNMK